MNFWVLISPKGSITRGFLFKFGTAPSLWPYVENAFLLTFFMKNVTQSHHQASKHWRTWLLCDLTWGTGQGVTPLGPRLWSDFNALEPDGGRSGLERGGSCRFTG